MPLNFISVMESTKVQGCKVAIHAPSGWGKTRILATAPEPFILSAEKGLLSLRQILKQQNRDLYGLEIGTHVDLIDAYNYCSSSAEMRRFQTIALDSGSEIAEKVLETTMKEAKDPRQAYGAMQVKVLEILKKFRDLPGKHVYISFKSSYEKDESGRMLWSPMMPGQKLGPMIPYLFDTILAGRIYQKDAASPQYPYLQTQLDLQYAAKDRSGMLAAQEPPDLAAIYNKMMGA